MIYNLHDDATDLDVNFTGDCIGTASTWENASRTLRWTEIHIFKTATGRWVVQKLGKTVVYHEGDERGCRLRSGAVQGKPITAKQLRDEDMPCPVCKPPYDPPYNAYKLSRETDRETVHVCDKPDGVLESLLSRDQDGVMYLSKTASRALNEARDNDGQLGSLSISV